MDNERILFIYQALSKGGTGSVIFSRMLELNTRGIQSRAIFLEHHGGGMEEVKNQILVSNDVTVLKEFILNYLPQQVLHLDTPGLIQLISAWLPGTKQFYEAHTTYAHKYLPLGDETIMDRIKGVIVPSEYQANMIKKINTVQDKPIHVVPNGLREIFFSQPSIGRVSAIPIVAWVGRLEAHKNWWMFLDIARQVVKANSQVQIWMIGGHRSTEIQHQLFWDAIVRYDLVNRLRWFPEVPGERMPILLNTVGSSGGCLVSTSKSESFGLAVLEAMACGSPAVVADVGGLSEIVQDGINGHLFNSNDVTGAVNAILRIVRDPSLQAKMGEAANQKAQEFRIKPVVDRFLLVLNSMIN